MQRWVRGGVVLAVVWVGCGTGAKSEPPRAADNPAPTSSPSVKSEPTAPAPSPDPLPATSAPEAPPSVAFGTSPIGKACAQPDPTFRCGKKGKVSVRYDSMAQIGGVAQPERFPCFLVPLHERGFGPRDQLACVGGDRLYARGFWMDGSGWEYVAVIGELTGVQLATAQKLLRFPAEPALGTTEAWQRALAQAERK